MKHTHGRKNYPFDRSLKKYLCQQKKLKKKKNISNKLKFWF